MQSQRSFSNLTDEMMSAAQSIACNREIDLRQAPDAECGILMTTAEEVLRGWQLRGIQHDLQETKRQLGRARTGHERWRAMHLQLLTDPTKEVFPPDFCPEVKPEGFAALDVPEMSTGSEIYRVTADLAEMLAVGHVELFMTYNVCEVAALLKYFPEKIGALQETHDALRRALPEIWPGTTQLDWDEHREQSWNGLTGSFSASSNQQ